MSTLFILHINNAKKYQQISKINNYLTNKRVK